MPSIKKFKLDTESMDKGVWATFYTDPKTKKSIRALVASVSSPEYTRAVSDLTRRRKNDIKLAGTGLNAEIIGEIQREAAGAVLLNGWTDIEDESGNPIPFSREQAMTFMTDRSYTEFYDWVMEVSNNRENYRKEAVAEAAKNLPSASSGS